MDVLQANSTRYAKTSDNFQVMVTNQCQYGDVTTFGQYPEWQKQISKFGLVQDRVREWRPSVLNKIKKFSCIMVQMLDIDGFRIDKGLTITVDAQADWSNYIRECASALGKNNFFIPGEIVSANPEASIYIGRGKEPQMALTTDLALTAGAGTNEEMWIRNQTRYALDAAAFHYTIYRYMCRFLGLSGTFEALLDLPEDWVEIWQGIVTTNDMVNANTGKFDPRHMYGTTNQDVFRWPSLANGTSKNLIGLFITTLMMPGIPMLMWGEEQAQYVLENTADNYLFGRQPMTSTLAWQLHGCYKIGASKYVNLPLDSAYRGCYDDSVSRDQRDPSHPVRNVIKRMYELRTIYPVLNDGFNITNSTKQTYYILLNGSGLIETEMGFWSGYRTRTPGQDFTGQGQGNQTVWLMWGNEEYAKNYTFDCTNANQSLALVAPFDTGTIVKNLFYPFEEYTLAASSTTLGLEGSVVPNGCLAQIEMPAWGFKAFVPKAKWVGSAPTITEFIPGHDVRILSNGTASGKEEVDISIAFSQMMNCNAVTAGIYVESNSYDGSNPQIQANSINCTALTNVPTNMTYTGQIPSVWTWSATLGNVANGVHSIVINNVTDSNGTATNAIDRFMFRIGAANNPMVYPNISNYNADLIQQNADGSLYIKHTAVGATKFRYSRDFSSHFSDWTAYDGSDTQLAAMNWTGTQMQAWNGEHVKVEYWSNLTASSNHFQYGDFGYDIPRRFAHLYIQGPFNQYSFDSGLPGTMHQSSNGTWSYDFMPELPSSFQINEWGVDPDGQPDNTLILGDVDKDGVLDRLPPGSLLVNQINITDVPPAPYTGWTIYINDNTYTHWKLPAGNQWRQLVIYVLLAVLPVLTSAATIYTFMKSFYKVTFNEIGVSSKQALIPLAVRRKFKKQPMSEKVNISALDLSRNTPILRQNSDGSGSSSNRSKEFNPLQTDMGAGKRRSVLIATMEYNIEDWGIKIKIGGLGVMAQLMGTNLGHQDIVWVVPCVSGVDYPLDNPVESMFITVLDKDYEIQVQYHVVRNITYVLLDAPVFRKQTKAEPYPPRMDDLESAIYYSAWNQCIAQTIQRFNPDLYHINDYHGALAPLHLLPRIIPCALSLHNAEFQGLWPMRNKKEGDEVCNVFNIDPAIAKKYVQFGEVFNLLHAGASYLRIHQRGFGAVGVSRKYGKRSFARYPIFWGLDKIGSLPNPDPTDTGAWDRNADPEKDEIVISEDFEAKRPELKRQAQEWAGLDQIPDAELFVFVGRWSQQKGIDLIADVFPSVLDQYKKVQLICVGPVIDLYGRFAALKLDKMMAQYPGRVYSKPEFTALPPFIFSGSEFALIPSRDEPFGLVAVEFGRKGALGVGARVGGLGQMPGWWYSIESMTPKHLVSQFKTTIKEALNSSQKTRAMMRARSALQRFPVAQWVEDLDTLQATAMAMSHKQDQKKIMNSPSMANLRGLFGHSQQDLSGSLDPSRPGTPRHGDSLLIPGTPGNTSSFASGHWTPPTLNFPSPGLSPTRFRDSSATSATLPMSPQDDDILLPPSIFSPGNGSSRGSVASGESRRFSTLSYDSVAGERKDFALQKVDPNFTDSSGIYLRAFERKLDQMGGKNDNICIEEILIKSEKDYFNSYRDAKMGHFTPSVSRANSPAPSRMGSRPDTPMGSYFEHSAHDSVGSNGSQELLNTDFPLGHDYKPPTGLKRVMLYRVGDWPIYTICLAFGQILAANSYQISLLCGSIGQTALELYIIATIYAVGSVFWWLLFRRLKSRYVLSIPFAFYGLAFFLIGMGPFATGNTRGWIQNVGTGLYSVASSSGSLFFALNFGDEGGAPIKDWVLRACFVQGTQQIYIAALWYWGASLVTLSSEGIAVTANVASNATITAVTVPIACLMWALGTVLFLGLPKFYHSTPGKVPSFYRSIFRRKIIVWFFIYVLIQNFWLSAPYGRNWRYLWTTQHAPAWAIAALVIVFFIGVWAAMLFFFSRMSKSHSWILPVFAIGLGAPRWCQMLWGVSQMANWLPWAGGFTASAILGRTLWLWLGVLDALQGVGFGMILLQTMTRFHICFTLLAAQVLGSAATIIGRAVAPDNEGPGTVFPNLALSTDGLGYPAFWLGWIFQVIVCIGFAAFFRKEQLSKP